MTELATKMLQYICEPLEGINGEHAEKLLADARRMKRDFDNYPNSPVGVTLERLLSIMGSHPEMTREDFEKYQTLKGYHKE